MQKKLKLRSQRSRWIHFTGGTRRRSGVERKKISGDRHDENLQGSDTFAAGKRQKTVTRKAIIDRKTYFWREEGQNVPEGKKIEIL